MTMDAGRTRSLVVAGVIAGMLGASGCATTGLAWVHESESGVDLSSPSETAAKGPTREVAHFTDPGTAMDLAQNPQGPVRRIDRTITLGETTAAANTSVDAADRPSNSSAPVVVNIYVTQSPQVGYGPAYGVPVGYGVPAGVSGVLGARASVARSTTVQPGRDWTPPPSYGPAFPYRMAPSSPWNGDGSERRSAR